MIAPILSGIYVSSVGSLPGRTCLSLHSEAALGAIYDAGLTPDDIDGVLCAYSLSETFPMLSSAVCEYVGLRPSFQTSLALGGATAASMILLAGELVGSGHCRHVLAVSGDSRLSRMSRDGAVAALSRFGHPQFEQPYGMTIPAAYALVARRYMHEYGVKEEDLASIAVAHRENAMRHPKAHMRTPITIDDVLNSRQIATPLRLLDCCLISDGAAAVVVSSSAAGCDLPHRPVALLGGGQGHTHDHLVAAPSLTDFGCARAAQLAFSRAGVKAADVDVAEIYDSFTVTIAIELESIGFFERGESAAAARSGALSLGGRLPCNTHGGLLSFGHSGAAGGMFHVVEAVQQLRGEADTRQVQDAQVAFVHGDGGVLSAHCSLVFARA